jgi:predicted small metal-binding protein
MERQRQLSVICAEDGTVIRADSEDELVRKYREHVREAHDIELTDEEAREEIEATMEDMEDMEDLEDLEDFDEDLNYGDMD